MWSSDQWFANLRPDFKLLFIYLFSNERASVCGLYELPLRVMSFETGLDNDTILTGFDEFARADKVLYEPATSIVYVRNMFKYQGSGSPQVKKRIEADLKAVPECGLKTLWLQTNRVLIGYVDCVDTSSSISIYSSVSGSEEGGGAGEETKSNWIPETPKQAATHPDIQTFEKVSGRFPGDRDYQKIIETIQFLREKHGDNLVDFLTPYWMAWSTRKNKNNKPYSPSSLVWLCEWAIQGEIPMANGHEPKSGESKGKRNEQAAQRVAERMRHVYR
jgi:hypothetical protein